jgi:hypothetical protein
LLLLTNCFRPLNSAAEPKQSLTMLHSRDFLLYSVSKSTATLLASHWRLAPTSYSLSLDQNLLYTNETNWSFFHNRIYYIHCLIVFLHLTGADNELPETNIRHFTL